MPRAAARICINRGLARGPGDLLCFVMLHWRTADPPRRKIKFSNDMRSFGGARDDSPKIVGFIGVVTTMRDSPNGNGSAVVAAEPPGDKVSLTSLPKA